LKITYTTYQHSTSSLIFLPNNSGLPIFHPQNKRPDRQKSDILIHFWNR